MSLKDILLAIAVVAIWGLNFTVIKLGLNQLPPLLFSSLRFFLVAFPAIFFVRFPKGYGWQVLGVGLFLGILKFGLLFCGIKLGAPAGISSVILQSQVFFTILIGWLLLGEKIQLRQAAGLMICFLGMLLLIVEQGISAQLLPYGLILGAGFCWGISNSIMKKVKVANFLAFMVWVSAVPPLPLLGLSFLYDDLSVIHDSSGSLFWNMSLVSVLSVLYVAYLSTLVAFSIWGALLSRYGSASVAPMALLVPVFGILGSYCILGETVSTHELFACTLIVLGLVFCVVDIGVLRRVFQKLHHRQYFLHFWKISRNERKGVQGCHGLATLACLFLVKLHAREIQLSKGRQNKGI